MIAANAPTFMPEVADIVSFSSISREGAQLFLVDHLISINSMVSGANSDKFWIPAR